MKPDGTRELLATIDRREGRSYVLTFKDGQQLSVPAHCLPNKVREGDVIHLQFLNDQQAKAEKAELARQLLEEILNGS